MTVVELLQELLRFDTTNPPGNERACIEFLQAQLGEGQVASARLLPIADDAAEESANGKAEVAAEALAAATADSAVGSGEE